jgi:hypothetical protein
VINRNGLRTAVTTGLGNAFANLSGVEFGQYVALAVLAVSTSSYGGALAMGRQRLFGTVLGSVLLLIGYEGLHALPLPVGLAITLGSQRLLGGLLGLKVGYKVGGMIIVMGWLVHDGDLGSWIPARFFWTAFGVLLTLLSLRLFWPARGLDLSLGHCSALLAQLQSCFRDLAATVELQRLPLADRPRPVTIERYRALRNSLQAMRSQRPALLQELGSLPERHPAYQLIQTLDAAASRLVTMVAGMVRHAPDPDDPPLVARLHAAEAELLGAMADRLLQWQQTLAGRRGLPPAPGGSLQLPRSWLELNAALSDPAAAAGSPERLERIATRLLLCRQAEQAIRDAEAGWRAVLARSSG